ncbi:MAG TPA: CopD family protein, partial [Ktedonobacteraceae bacterium]|nr:CopD family protein [Ktedonobacteraceae bacterium]
FGPFAFRWLVLQPLADREQIDGALQKLVSLGLVMLVLAEPVALVAQAASINPGALLDLSLLGDIMGTSFGRVLAQRVGAALLLWILLGTVHYNARRARIAILILGLVLAVIDGEASHAISTQPIWLGMLANTLHIISMGVWVGGLVSLLVLWRQPEVRAQRSLIAWRFGQIASIAVIELVLSGIVLASLYVKRPEALLSTDYGRILLLKGGVLLLVLSLVLVGRRAKQVCWWRWEVIWQCGLLCIACLLVSLPPPL